MHVQNSKQSMLMDAYNNSCCENIFCFEKQWNDAILGYTINKEDEFVVVYDERLIIKCIITSENCSEEEAYDYYSYNIEYLMNNNNGTSPIIINRI
ncbi:hypothetical protein [Clostridium perfringens]|uniref:hypothetical protein n=1 Tax=Clostridium perfringens TaxID=1502 RepID=UPI003CF3536F